MSYVLNPRLRVRRCDEGRLLIEAAVRGEGLRQSFVTEENVPFLRQLAENPRATVPADDALTGELARLGVLVRRDAVSRGVQFSATLRELPGAAPKTLAVNRRVRLAESAGDAPLARGRVAWVVDPVRGIELPYWIDAAEERAIARALDRGDIPSNRAMRLSLMSAGILHDPAVTAVERRRLARRMAVSRARLVSHGYMELIELLPAPFLAAVRRYFRAVIREGYLPFGDSLVERRFAVHNEPLAVWLHQRILPLIARAVPRPIKPSYTYTVAYVGGAVLARHTDREQCEYTVSMTIDATPSQSREHAWPLCLDMEGGAVRSRLAPGDGLLFKGRQVPHFRDELPSGRTTASILFHFVHAEFEGSLE